MGCLNCLCADCARERARPKAPETTHTFWSQRGDGPWILSRSSSKGLGCLGIAYRHRSSWYWQAVAVSYAETELSKSVGPFKTLTAAQAAAEAATKEKP